MTLSQSCAEIQQRCDAATEGPWFQKKGASQWGVVAQELKRGSLRRRIATCGSPRFYNDEELLAADEANATFIAHARDDIPYLLRTLAALEAENKRMREALQALADTADRVGVRFFDTDTMEPEVEAMQSATQAVRVILRTHPTQAAQEKPNE